MQNRRKLLFTIVGMGVLYPITTYVWANRFHKKEIYLNVVLYNYLSRAIIDIHFNNTDLGVSNSYGGTGIISGVEIPYGPQHLSWRLDGPKGTTRNGETVLGKPQQELIANDIPTNTRYIGIHIYPDENVEFTFSEYIPDRTPDGIRLIKISKLSAG